MVNNKNNQQQQQQQQTTSKRALKSTISIPMSRSLQTSNHFPLFNDGSRQRSKMITKIKKKNINNFLLQHNQIATTTTVTLLKINNFSHFYLAIFNSTRKRWGGQNVILLLLLLLSPVDWLKKSEKLAVAPKNKQVF